MFCTVFVNKLIESYDLSDASEVIAIRSLSHLLKTGDFLLLPTLNE